MSLGLTGFRWFATVLLVLHSAAHPPTASGLPGSPDLRTLVHPTLGAWLTYRKSLCPRYGRAWLEVAIAICMMLSGIALHIVVTTRWGNQIGLACGPLVAGWIGFWLNALITFGHEAAHYNLSRNRRRNDAIADWTIWLFFPQTTQAYRRSHWQHHLHLGDHLDTEVSYHNCLSPWFLASVLTGIYPVARFLEFVRSKHAGLAHTTSSLTSLAPGLDRTGPLLRAFATHGVVIGVALWLQAYATVGVWIAGVTLVFPCLAAVRQIMEHRALDAACDIDFRQELHGPVNRMFGTGLFSRYYGAAGFNRHLLHHWDPTVSYTRFTEMEHYLNGTHVATRLAAARSTYWLSLRALVRKGMHAGA